MMSITVVNQARLGEIANRLEVIVFEVDQARGYRGAPLVRKALQQEWLDLINEFCEISSGRNPEFHWKGWSP